MWLGIGVSDDKIRCDMCVARGRGQRRRNVHIYYHIVYCRSPDTNRTQPSPARSLVPVCFFLALVLEINPSSFFLLFMATTLTPTAGLCPPTVRDQMRGNRVSFLRKACWDRPRTRSQVNQVDLESKAAWRAIRINPRRHRDRLAILLLIVALGALAPGARLWVGFDTLVDGGQRRVGVIRVSIVARLSRPFSRGEGA